MGTTGNTLEQLPGRMGDGLSEWADVEVPVTGGGIN